MNRLFLLAIIILVSCAPSSAPLPASTPESPKPVRITLELPTAAATSFPRDVGGNQIFTPIPPTFTLTATATVTPTATSTQAAINTIAPTRTQRPTAIPTIFLPPTDTPVPIVVQPTNPPAQACCKICRSGKACGDSCIAKDKTCNKPPGCACNG